jgi:hypothetical protein
MMTANGQHALSDMVELQMRLSRRLTQTVKTLFPSNDKCFLPIRQQFYAGIVGKAEAGNAGEQPAKE